MDVRTQLPVNEYLRRRLSVPYVDTITEPGPVRILAEEPDSVLAESILNRVEVSVKKHGSQFVAVVGHWDCTGNPVPEDRQKEQLDLSVRFVAARYPNVRVVGLWVDSAGSVEEFCAAKD